MSTDRSAPKPPAETPAREDNVIPFPSRRRPECDEPPPPPPAAA